MKLRFVPLKRPAKEIKSASAALWTSQKELKVFHSYRCSDGSLKPDPPRSKAKATPFLSITDRTALSLGEFNKRKPLNQALGRFFYDKVVQRKEAVYQTALEAGLGVYEMDIPARALLLPTYRRNIAHLKSEVDYAHFRVVWQGIRPVQWVLLSVPIGHTHSVTTFDYCDAQGNVRPLGDSQSEYNKVLETRRYAPKTKRSRELFIADRKAKAKHVKEKLAELEAKRKQLEEEIGELSGE